MESTAFACRCADHARLHHPKPVTRALVQARARVTRPGCSRARDAAFARAAPARGPCVRRSRQRANGLAPSAPPLHQRLPSIRRISRLRRRHRRPYLESNRPSARRAPTAEKRRTRHRLGRARDARTVRTGATEAARAATSRLRRSRRHSLTNRTPHRRAGTGDRAPPWPSPARRSHDLTIRFEPNPAFKRDRPLLDEHREAVARRQAACATGHHPRRALAPVRQVKHAGCSAE